MPSPSNPTNPPTKFPSVNDFATSPSFEYHRIQLIELCNEVEPHLVHSSSKNCGHCWSIVLNSMYDKDNGQLRGYQKYNKQRNFRCFMEKVFKKVIDYIELKGNDSIGTNNNILELKIIALDYFRIQKEGDELARKRK